MAKAKIEKAIVASDIHHPFQDQDLIDAAFEAWIDIEKKHGLPYFFLNGDIIDCYALSHFSRSISMSQASFETELESTRHFLRRLRKTFPKTKFYYVEGNHEWRLRRLIMEPKERMRFEWMDKYLHYRTTLELDKLDIEYVEHNGTAGEMRLQFGDDCLIGHWSIARHKAGQTASHLIERYPGYKIVQGHVHHGARVSKHAGRHSVWAIENPCMCPIDQVDYTIDPNWQQGFTVLTNYNGCVHAELITVEQETRTFICEGKLYEIKDTATKPVLDRKVRVS